jgi:hypothetical protein
MSWLRPKPLMCFHARRPRRAGALVQSVPALLTRASRKLHTLEEIVPHDARLNALMGPDKR